MAGRVVAAQFVGYVFVGGLSSVFDVGGASLLAKLGAPALPASAFAFTVATIVNYFISYWLLFQRGRFSRFEEIARVFAVSVAGLGLNTLIVWLLISMLGAGLVVAKMAALPVVIVWNFFARLIFVFHKEPARTLDAMLSGLGESKPKIVAGVRAAPES
jgi:putative flippase GtrA